MCSGMCGVAVVEEVCIGDMEKEQGIGHLLLMIHGGEEEQGVHLLGGRGRKTQAGHVGKFGGYGA